MIEKLGLLYINVRMCGRNGDRLMCLYPDLPVLHVPPLHRSIRALGAGRAVKCQRTGCGSKGVLGGSSVLATVKRGSEMSRTIVSAWRRRHSEN